ncbi:MAG: MotA/TolQ/ExbB proton channel family protein [Isosphaeraceae bacterium]
MAGRTARSREPWLGYRAIQGLLILAVVFPAGLMVFNPTLMFERGWEQFLGTGIYWLASVFLGMELIRSRREETAFRQATGWLEDPSTIPADDRRLLASRVRQLAATGDSTAIGQLVELNREASALDQEHTAGRFVLTRYILYLLPVIGFIGTVEGISKALMNISKVLPMVKELDGFLGNLTNVTSSLQVAFDSTLLALFLSASLMLVQTLIYRRAEDVLARIDRWIVEHAFPRLAAGPEISTSPGETATLRDEMAAFASRTTEALEKVAVRLGEGLGPHVDRFAEAVDRLPVAVAAIERGASSISRAGEDLAELSSLVDELDDIARRGLASMTRIEAALIAPREPDPQLELIRRAVERSCVATESLGEQWAAAYEKSNRANQEQLARTLVNLKDALELLQVSMEQGNALYRNIVKKLIPGGYPVVRSGDQEAA